MGVHACGKLTDQCLDIATELNSRVAVMPCCYGTHHMRGPEVLERMLGGHLAVDVDRTYRMEARGYRVDWQCIPEAITPMNRILVAVPITRRAKEKPLRTKTRRRAKPKSATVSGDSEAPQ